jgi:hypothetical protein
MGNPVALICAIGGNARGKKGFAIDADASHNHRVEDYSSKIGGIEETWIR